MRYEEGHREMQMERVCVRGMINNEKGGKVGEDKRLNRARTRERDGVWSIKRRYVDSIQ